MKPEEQEITKKDFKKLIDSSCYAYSEHFVEKIFELAKSYHKQESSKSLTESASALPTEDDARRQFNVSEGNEHNSVGFQSYVWMRDKASHIIANKDAIVERMAIRLQEMAKELIEKDKEIDFIDKEYDWIEEQISNIMIEDGPDGHSDGSGIIADFVMSLIEGREDGWVEEYEKGCEIRAKEKAKWRK